MNWKDRVLSVLAKTVLVVEQVDEQTAAERISTCEGCQFFDHVSRRCKVCKCFIDAKAYSRENRNPIGLRNEITHCPKGKWGDIEIANEYRKIDGLPPIK